MKKFFTAMMVCALAGVMVLGGCSGAKKKAAAPANPFAQLEDDFCNPDKAKDVLMNDVLLTFIVKMQVQAMKAMIPEGQEVPKEMAAMMDEKALLAEMKKGMDEEKAKEKPEFASCSAKVTAKSCDEIYKEIGDMIAGEDPDAQKALGDPTKFIAGIGAELKIKDCGIMAISFEEKKEKKKNAGNMYVGDVNGVKTIFFADKNSMK